MIARPVMDADLVHAQLALQPLAGGAYARCHRGRQALPPPHHPSFRIRAILECGLKLGRRIEELIGTSVAVYRITAKLRASEMGERSPRSFPID